MPNKSQINRISLPFQLLKTFTEKELISFEKLLASGYLSSNKNLSALLKILKKQALHHKSFIPQLQYDVYKTLFDKEKIGGELQKLQSNKLNRLINDLGKLAEKFLMFERIKDTDKHNTVLLFPELNDRKQSLLYEKHLRAIEKKLSAIKKRGVEYHNECYNIQKEKGEMLFRNNALVNEDNYDVIQYHTDIKFLLEKLQYHLAEITIQSGYPNKVFDFSSYEACKALFNLPQYQENPLIQLYLLNIDLVEKADNDTYNLLFDALQQYQDIIPRSFLEPFYVNLNNYCAFQIAKGKFEFYKKLMTTYEVMHSNNLLAKNNIIDVAVLKNVVTIGCRLKEFDWANKILEENIGYVSDDIRESVFHYNKGVIEFSIHNYGSAQENFLRVGKIDEFHSIDQRVALLQCFYEIDKHYEFYTEQMIDSFRIFLTTTKKLTRANEVSYKNFISHFKKLYNFKKFASKYEKSLKIKKTIPSIIVSIKNEQLVWQREWLLTKAETLKNNCV